MHFVVEVKMKVLLIFILLSVATTGVLSELKIDALMFMRDYLYIPYKDVPGVLNPSRSHAKQVFVLALIPPGQVTWTSLWMENILIFTKNIRPIPWKNFGKVKNVEVPLYHASSKEMSVYLSVIDYAKYKDTTPVEAHPDYSIVKNFQKILSQFRVEFHASNPSLVLMYSYFSPCNDCTNALIGNVKKYIPGPIFIGFSKIFVKKGQTPVANMHKLAKNGFIILPIPAAELFSLEYLRQILQ